MLIIKILILGRTRLYSSQISVGDAAPYNGYPSFATLNTSKAEKNGFIFTEVHNRIYETIDNYIKLLL